MCRLIYNIDLIIKFLKKYEVSLEYKNTDKCDLYFNENVFLSHYFIKYNFIVYINTINNKYIMVFIIVFLNTKYWFNISILRIILKKI